MTSLNFARLSHQPFMAQASQFKVALQSPLINWEIIVYSRSIINAYSFLSHEWWVPLIKFMVGPTIYVRGESTHLWYFGST